jgi:hypothetical protein
MILIGYLIAGMVLSLTFTELFALVFVIFLIEGYRAMHIFLV